MESSSVLQAFNFIEDNPHPRLWRLLAEEALEKLDFDIAEKAFVRSRDYQGIKFVKRLKIMQDDVRQKAEIAAYFRRFEDAEELYLKSGETLGFVQPSYIHIWDLFRKQRIGDRASYETWRLVPRRTAPPKRRGQ